MQRRALEKKRGDRRREEAGEERGQR